MPEYPPSRNSITTRYSFFSPLCGINSRSYYCRWWVIAEFISNWRCRGCWLCRWGICCWGFVVFSCRLFGSRLGAVGVFVRILFSIKLRLFYGNMVLGMLGLILSRYRRTWSPDRIISSHTDKPKHWHTVLPLIP